MSSYLLIAERVLENSSQPLNAKEMLKRAYLQDMIPVHLYGKTQHKTLQARISEDIRKNGEDSLFYRVEPGVFYLRRLKGSETDHREFFARPRFRELHRSPVLVVARSIACKYETLDGFIEPANTQNLLAYDKIRFENAKRITPGEDSLPVWSFVVVCRGEEILTYRQGRYRQQRDGFENQRTIGFSTLVEMEQITLFDHDERAVISAGLKSTVVDLGYQENALNLPTEQTNASLEFSVLFEETGKTTELVCVVAYECPDWLEPMKRRLAINDLQWLKATHPVNNLDDFDPWSKKILPQLLLNRRNKAVA